MLYVHQPNNKNKPSLLSSYKNYELRSFIFPILYTKRLHYCVNYYHGTSNLYNNTFNTLQHFRQSAYSKSKHDSST